MSTQTIALGRLTKDPIKKGYGTDGEMSIFTIAVETGKDEAQFYDCIAFNRTAENINKHFVKGRPIQVTGFFQNNNTEREVNGQTVTNYGMTFLVNRFSFVPTDNTQNQQGGQQRQPQGGQQQNNQQQGNFQNNFGGNQQGGQQQTTNNPFEGFAPSGGGQGNSPF